MTERELLDHGYCYALSLAHDKDDAADIVQEAFCRLYRKYGKVSSKAVLFTTVRNLFFDRCRRPKLVIYMDELESVEQAPARSASEPGTALDLDELLAHLRPEEREALYLNAVKGYSASEIAKLTGQPRNTVLSLMHRSKKKLKAEIQRENACIKNGGNHV